ncbi:MAG: single-stranded DNA-binding protein [Spirochaetales bacterium]|nr:single-stranded DNA-binding protein [Spirochaetales bacterium]
MSNLNQILIEGNLVRNPELRRTPKGTPVCTFSVASNRFYKQDQDEEFQKEVSFFDITIWTELATNCATTLKKGRGVRVIGRLKQDRWQDPEGKQRSKVHIIADHVIFKPEFKGKKSERNGRVAEYEEANAF